MSLKKENKKKTICLFGTYESTFPRTKTIIKALQRNGYDVVECHVPFWELKREKRGFFGLSSGLQTFFRIILIDIKLIAGFFRLKKIDALVVGYNGYFDLPVAKVLAKIKGIPVISTPVFPLYETLVEDRKYVNKKSFFSRLVHKVDEIGCRMADLIIIETGEYIKYYHREFGIPEKKFVKIPLGADEDNFFPRRLPGENAHPVKVLFYGKFIPLQGIPSIIRAAKLLEDERDIRFKVIGSGQLSEETQDLASVLNIGNVDFIPWVDYTELPLHIQEADICLGIFGNTPKSKRGIPIKVYEALSMKKPIITGDTPAAREVFTDRLDAILCEMANERALADSILLLKNDPGLRERIAEEGHRLYQEFFSGQRIAKDLKKALTPRLEKVHDSNIVL